VQPAARLRWNRCLSFGGTLFRAELNCVVEGEVDEGVKFGFDFFGDYWAFVCFVGSCAEWGVAEQAIR
jgi:hypothetical protein